MIEYTGSRLYVRLAVKADISLSAFNDKIKLKTVQNAARIKSHIQSEKVGKK